MKNIIDFVVLDLETTGFDFKKNEIIEIGATRFVDGKFTDELSIFVKPQKKVPKFIKQLTNITDEQLNSGDSLPTALKKLIDFVKDDIIVCHNVSFDIGFLNQKMEDQGFPKIQNDNLDTLDLSRIYLPFILNHKLGTVAEYFGIDLSNAHRAIYDAQATGNVLLKLIDFIDHNIPLKLNHRLYEISRVDKHKYGLTYFLQRVVEYQKKNTLLRKTTGKDIDFHNRNYIEHKPKNADKITIDEIFKKDGLFSKNFKKYELRQGQVNMAKAILNNFKQEEFLLVEAGTGVGKSLAYLIPSAIHTNKHDTKVVVSTNTKNLQEQLFYQDLPTMKNSVNIPFKASLLKGRRNYICQRKWLDTTFDFSRLFTSTEVLAYMNLVVWKEFTKTGDITENSSFETKRDGRVWKKVASDPFLCQGRKCAHFNECYLMSIRRKAEKSNIVIINHHLLLADMQSEFSALGKYDYLVIDEAHNIPQLAPSELGISLFYPEFSSFFNQLHSAKNKFQSGVLVGIKAAAKKSKFSEQKSLLTKIKEAIELIDDNKNIFDKLFKDIGDLVSEKGSYGKLRITNIDDHPFLTEQLGKIILFWEKLSRSFVNIQKIFSGIDKQLFVDYDKHNEFLGNIMERIADYYSKLNSLYNPNLKDYAFWMENFRIDDKKYPNGMLVYCPLNVNEILNEILYKKVKSIIFTSATIAIRKKFKYFAGRMGLNLLENGFVQELIVKSPFDYEKQAKVLVAGFLPDPKDRFFTAQSTELIKLSVESSKSGTMVLFTSYKNLNDSYDKLKDYFDEKDIILHAQGKGISRSAMLKEFRKHRNSVLLGTNSFWEGVDVPGESLELLILFKLPFMVPSEPIVEAFLEKMEAEGKNSFMHFMLPNALLKYKQGFGRLIRHKTDRGIVLVLDNRIQSKKYGKYFIDTVPAKTVISQSYIEIEDHLTEWFKKI